MNLSVRVLALLLLAVMSCAIFAGCGTSMSVTKVREAPNFTPVMPDSVRVFKQGDSLSGDYVLLGKVYAAKSVDGFTAMFAPLSEKKIVRLLRAEAAELGAHAIIGVRTEKCGSFYGERNNTRRWGSGLAVRFIADPVSEPLKRADFIVGLPLPHGAFSPDTLQSRQTSVLLWAWARHILEQKGYYVVPLLREQVFSDLGAVAALSGRELAGLCGENVGTVFFMTLETAGGVDIGLAQTKTVGLRGRLLSLETGRNMWEIGGHAAATNLGPIGGRAAQRNAAVAAVRDLLESVPDVTSGEPTFRR